MKATIILKPVLEVKEKIIYEVLNKQMSILKDNYISVLLKKLEVLYKSKNAVIKSKIKKNDLELVITIDLIYANGIKLTKSMKDYLNIKESYESNIKKIEEEITRWVIPLFNNIYRNKKVEFDIKTKVE